MSTTSTAHDLFRFVRLRPVAGRPPAVVDLILESTNLSGTLGATPRAERRDHASEWIDTSDALAVADEYLFKEALAAVRGLRTQPGYGTLRVLLIRLAHAKLLEAELDPSDLQGMIMQLSDLLLALLYAPRRTTPPVEALEDVFRTLLLLRTALARGIRRQDLQGDADDPLLDAALDEVLDRPIAVPEELAADIARLSPGVADLLVVKQHIRCYEPGEIAHIETIAAGETRERVHRRLDRSEETFTTELETEIEKENELETAEQFELSEEANRTIKEDQQLSFGVSLSAAYGSVQFGSEFQFARRDSREESAKSSTSYAKDVVERSLERVRERVHRSRTTKVLQEVEEQNRHAFENETSAHVNAIYQFVDKVYEAQVFNYGEREMLDLSVPDPASYLRHRRESPAPETEELTVPQPPPDLPEDAIATLEDRVDGVPNYERWAARYRATGIEPPPEERITISTSHEYPGEEEKAEPESTAVLDVKIPKEYLPFRARATAVVWSPPDDKSDQEKYFFHQLAMIGIAILDRLSLYNFEADDRYPPFAVAQTVKVLRPNLAPDVSDRTDQVVLFGMEDDSEIPLDSGFLPAEGGLKLGVFAFNTLRYVLSVKVDCRLTEEARQGWRLGTFDAIQGAYAERLMEYQEAFARYQQERRRRGEQENLDRQFGTAPSRQEEIIRTELKKHCTAIITEDFYEGNDSPPVMTPDSPPRFDLEAASRRGAFVRFFEQALEWEHIQYVFYPYYWASNSTWNRRFAEDDPAHAFRQFLQAGWARVVIPVRPGFEQALHHFLLTGEVWLGEAPPRIGDDAYVSIADEIRSRTDQGVAQAVPYGTPWRVQVPTSLVYLREPATLPKWERVEPTPEDEPQDHWRWRPTDDGGSCSP